jgi:hypothetical protein
VVAERQGVVRWAFGTPHHNPLKASPSRLAFQADRRGLRPHFVPLGKGDYRGCGTNQRRPPAAKDAAKLSQSFDSLGKGGQM